MDFIYHVDFYATAAHLIPLLLLAMIGSRLLTRRPEAYPWGYDAEDPASWKPSQAVGAMVIVVVMAFGEFAALMGVYTGVSSPWLSSLSWVGLGAGLAGIFVPIWAYQKALAASHLQSVPGNRSSMTRLAVMMGLGAVAAVIALALLISVAEGESPSGL